MSTLLSPVIVSMISPIGGNVTKAGQRKTQVQVICCLFDETIPQHGERAKTDAAEHDHILKGFRLLVADLC